MAQRKGVGAIRTYCNMPDRRRKRTAHGAYVELASIALHRLRLLQEYKVAARRNEEIEEQVRRMERHSKVLVQLAESPDERLVETICRAVPAKAERAVKGGEHGSGLREMAFDY